MEAQYSSLKGASVLVTGGATGLGADFVRGFTQQGARVGVLDLDAEAGTALARETGAHFARADLRDLDNLGQTITDLARVRPGPLPCWSTMPRAMTGMISMI